MQKKKQVNDLFVKNGMDVPFFLIMLVLMTIGLVMLLSASYIYAFHYSGSGDSLYYFKRQIVFAVLGIIGMLVYSRLNYKYLKMITNIGLLGALVILAITVLRGGGDGINRWFGIGAFSFQPSEMAKFMLILFCAAGLDKNHKKIISAEPSKAQWAQKITELSKGSIKITRGTTTMFFYALVIGFTAGMVLLGSHLSGAILILLIGVAMLWIGECRARWFAVLGMVVAVVLVYVMFNYEDLPLKEYMIVRIKAWRIKDFSPDDARWQINHSLYALGSGGFLGAGIGNSKQKYLYVSESHTDFIFSIIGEELGFVGCFIILAIFICLILRGIYIGMRAKDRYGALLVFGMTSQLALQVMFNVAVVTDTVPNTGISLPFFSYGGSALLITLVEMGTILAVSRQADLPKVYSIRKSRKESK
ncbi:MAG: cell division protein FtsW [Clostridia bacterium]|nr:cell division protein FtsW [Clostridia bacterium]